MHSGCDDWLMLVPPTSHVIAMEAGSCTGVEKGSAGTTKPFCWENVVAEYADMFEPPGMPAERDTVHRIKVEPGFEPPFRQQYCVSAAELAEVRQ